MRSVKDGSLGVGGKDKARGRVKDGKARETKEQGKTRRRVKDGKSKRSRGKRMRLREE